MTKGLRWEKAAARDKTRRVHDKPASEKQLRLIVQLCSEIGAVVPSAAMTSKEASAFIDGLFARKRRDRHG